MLPKAANQTQTGARKSTSKRNLYIALGVAVCVALVGYVLITTHAAGPFASVTAATGTVTGPAAVVDDTAATNGKAIQFIAQPTPGTRPDPFPASLKPDATNTGLINPGIVKEVDGDQIFGTNYNGQTISNKDFHGFVQVTGSNITFTNCIFHGGKATHNTALLDTQVEDSTPPYTHRGGKNIVVQDSEFVPMNPSVLIDGIWGENITLVRINTHGSVDGMKLSNNSTLRDSYSHDTQWYDVDPNTTDGTHNDAVQILDGTNIQVIHNNLNPNDSRANSSIQLTQDFGTVGTVKIDQNWADWGGCSFNLTQKPSGPLTAISVTNNRFGRHMEYTGCAIILGGGVTLAANAGNVWDDTSQAVPTPQREQP